MLKRELVLAALEERSTYRWKAPACSRRPSLMRRWTDLQRSVLSVQHVSLSCPPLMSPLVLFSFCLSFFLSFSAWQHVSVCPSPSYGGTINGIWFGIVHFHFSFCVLSVQANWWSNAHFWKRKSAFVSRRCHAESSHVVRLWKPAAGQL